MLRIYFEGKPVLINSLEGPYLDWTYVEDIAEGMERAWATPNLPEPVYSLTCGSLYSIGDVLEQFQNNLPNFEYQVVPENEANYLVPGDPPGPIPSNARMQRDFGWAPSTAFEDGMKQYLSWIQENGPQ
jgi:nucleoside-diphosphate-sugar epimerase